MKYFAEGNFPGGTQGIRDITNNGYYLDWPTYEAFAQRSEEYGEAYAAAIEEGKKIEQSIKDGTLVIEYNPEVPNWKQISGK